MKIIQKKTEISLEYLRDTVEHERLNTESVTRLNMICKILPNYEKYRCRSVGLEFDFLKCYDQHDPSYKNMTRENLTLSFHGELVKLWNDTILSNFECADIVTWVSNSSNQRREIIRYFETCTNLLYKCFCHKTKGSFQVEVLNLHKVSQEINDKLGRLMMYPSENWLFESDSKNDNLEHIKNAKNLLEKYKIDVRNITNQFFGFIKKEEKNARLTMVNLKMAISRQQNMQDFFRKLLQEQVIDLTEHDELCRREIISAQTLLEFCEFYNGYKRQPKSDPPAIEFLSH